MMLGRLDFRCAPFSQIPFSAHRLAHPPVPLRLPHSSPLHQALFSEGQSPAKILVVSAVVITGLKLRFLIAPMRSYYLLIRSFWDQHQTDNNNKHSFLELSNDPACPAGLVAMGRGSVCAWKWQGELRGISWRFRGAGTEVQLTSRWAPAWDFWLAGGTSAVIAQGARRTLHSPAQGLERWSWVVFPQDLRKFLENDLVTVSCIFLQIFSYVHIKVNKLLSECVCVCSFSVLITKIQSYQTSFF